MGKSCPYCTLWADGYNGQTEHLESRAAFAVSSPDSTEVQREFRQSRNWRFRMVSCEGSSFPKDMGFYTDEGEYKRFQPGVAGLTGGRMLPRWR